MIYLLLIGKAQLAFASIHHWNGCSNFKKAFRHLWSHDYTDAGRARPRSAERIKVLIAEDTATTMSK